MESERLARRTESLLENKKGQDIRLLNVRDLTAITDYMIVATGTSRTHNKSLADELVEKTKERGRAAAVVEGLPAAEWVLVDLGAVVVHLMLASVRTLYDLEELWAITPGGKQAGDQEAREN